MNEDIIKYFDHYGITEDDIIVNSDNEIAFKTPSGIKSIVKAKDGQYYFYPDYSSVNKEVKRLDKIYDNHKKAFDAKNDENLKGLPLLWTINEAYDNWAKGFNEEAKKVKVPEAKREEVWGNDEDVKRNYQRWLKNRQEKVFNMSDENLAKIKSDPYFQNYKMAKVPIGNLINDQTDLSSHSEIWGNDTNKFAYDPNKDKHTMYATRKADGQYVMGDGRHRTRALKNGGYTHVNIPVLDEKEEMKKIGIID